MYAFDSRIRYSETDSEGYLTLDALLNYFQDCSTFHSEDVGLGIGYMKEIGQVWVLSSWQIVVNRYPKLGEKVKIVTLPYELKVFLGYRNFAMLDEQGEYLAKANSLWSLLDVGTGKGTGLRKIDPVTDAYLKEDSYLEMDTVQLRGVDRTTRSTSAVLDKGAKIVVRERIMTDGDEDAVTKFRVELNGEDCGADLVSRSVARGNSHQAFYSVIEGNTRCTGHSACDAILAENGRVDAQPALNAANVDAALIHEAAIGKIAGEQILKLCSLGLTREEAEEKIIEGFLK